MAKKKLTDHQVMKERSEVYGPVKDQMEVIGSIQFELTQYCVKRNGEDPSRETLGHLAAMNQGVVKMVRSVSNPEHLDNFQDLRNFTTIAEDGINDK